MNEQRHRHAEQQRAPLTGPEAPDAAASAERLAASRDQLDRIYATADAILDEIDIASNARFLEQARQSGGQ